MAASQGDRRGDRARRASRLGLHRETQRLLPPADTASVNRSKTFRRLSLFFIYPIAERTPSVRNVISPRLRAARAAPEGPFGHCPPRMRTKGSAYQIEA